MFVFFFTRRTKRREGKLFDKSAIYINRSFDGFRHKDGPYCRLVSSNVTETWDMMRIFFSCVVSRYLIRLTVCAHKLLAAAATNLTWFEHSALATYMVWIAILPWLKILINHGGGWRRGRTTRRATSSRFWGIGVFLSLCFSLFFSPSCFWWMAVHYYPSKDSLLPSEMPIITIWIQSSNTQFDHFG